MATDTKLLEILIDIVETSHNERHSIYAKSSSNAQQHPEESDSASGESGEEDIDNSHESNQRETMEDLHDELTRLEINEEASTLETLILIVEFYVKSNDTEGFQKHVRRPDKFLLHKPRPRIVDLQNMATNMERQNLPFRAVMLHKAIATMFKYEYERHPENNPLQTGMITPDMAVSGILESMQKVFDLRKLLQSEEETTLYLKHFVPIMYDMLTNLREIRHANRKLRADCESWGLLFIALIHGINNEAVEMYDVVKSSINVCEKRFKKRSTQHMIYGISCMTLATAEVFLDKDAASTLELGIKSLQESTEFTTWEAKVKVIAKAQDFATVVGVTVNSEHGMQA